MVSQEGRSSPAAFAALACAAGVLSAAALLAEPALGRPRTVGPLAVVYPDARDASTFYYPPGPLRVAEDPAGGPDLRFLQMIYMGSRTTDDPGRFIARSVLSFRVQMSPPPAQDLRAAAALLPAGSRLLAVPIRRAETRLVWTPLEGTSSPDARTPGPAPSAPATRSEPQALGEGQLEEADAGTAPADGYWTERLFTVNPEPYSSQALWEALQKGRVQLSVAYSFYAEGDATGASSVTGSPEAVAAASRAAESGSGGTGHEPKKDLVLLRADSLAILLDPAQVSARLKRIDVNQTVPPGYAALDVRCYDFSDALRPDLALKLVEVAAQGVSGRRVVRTASFRASAPDLAAASVRFPFAVRLDRPYRFRVIEVTRDGDRSEGAWQERSEWARLVDVTTRPSAGPTPRPEATPEGDAR